VWPGEWKPRIFSVKRTPTTGVGEATVPPTGIVTLPTWSSRGVAWARSGAFHSGLPSMRRMAFSTLRSATAAMVDAGLTPVLEGRAEPSSTYSPG
jgi:hypothetical protein